MKHRSYHSEKLDDFNFRGSELEKTLQGLSIINRIFGNRHATLNAIKNLLRTNEPKNLKIIDLGCGAGDNLRAIAKWSESNKYSIELIGIDGNQHVLNYASALDPDTSITYKQADILSTDFELESCDILISSHFIYHFSDEALIDFLKRSRPKVRLAFIFSELYRSRLSYFLFKVFSILLPVNAVVKRDGLIAIKRSFRASEIKQILSRAHLTTYSLKWKWAFRYILTIIVD